MQALRRQVAAHHPVALRHRSDASAHAVELAAALTEDAGIDYGLCRWSRSLIRTPRIGRFAVNVTTVSAIPDVLDTTVRDRLRRCAAPLTGTNTLPYEGVLVLRQRFDGQDLEFSWDEEAFTDADVDDLLRVTAETYATL